MRFYIFGASFADKVYGKIKFYHQSPLYKLATKDGIKDIEAALKNNDIIPEYVKLRTSKSKGGKYCVVFLSFHLIVTTNHNPSHALPPHDLFYR